MVTNPFIAQVFRENGADSITTMHDLGLPVLHEMRRLNKGLCLDVPIDVYKTKGGYIRFYELAEIVQVASPVMLKMGASAQDSPYEFLKEQMVRERVRRVQVGLEYLRKYLRSDLHPIHATSPYSCIPTTRTGRKAAAPQVASSAV
jgi:hypothetical protein